MTIADIMQQAQALPLHERKELIKQLVDTMDSNGSQDQFKTRVGTAPKTGAEIAAMLMDMDPIELVDPEIEDPVEWVKAQRQKEADRLKPYWDGDK